MIDLNLSRNLNGYGVVYEKPGVFNSCETEVAYRAFEIVSEVNSRKVAKEHWPSVTAQYNWLKQLGV